MVLDADSGVVAHVDEVIPDKRATEAHLGIPDKRNALLSVQTADAGMKAIAVVEGSGTFEVPPELRIQSRVWQLGGPPRPCTATRGPRATRAV